MPGKVLSSLDPELLDRLAARLPLGSALVSATNGKTTTAAMAAQILSPSGAARAQRLRGESRVGRRLGPPLGQGCGAGAVRGGRGRAAGDRAPGAAACDLPREPVPRPARPLRRARARRRALAGRRARARRRTRARRQRGRPSGRRSLTRAPGLARLRARRSASGACPSSCTRRTRSGACAAGVRTSTRRSTSGISATTDALRAAMRGRSSTSSAADLELRGLEGVDFTLGRPR